MSYCHTKTEPATDEQLLHFRNAAIIIASVVLTTCIVCIILIKRNITLEFSLKIIGIIVVINIGFICNQVFSELRDQSVWAKIA